MEMKYQIRGVVLAAAVGLVLSEAHSQVTLYPPPELPASPHYEVQVLREGVWTNSHVNFDPARTSGSGSGDECCRSFSWTTFETGGPVQVRVKRMKGGFRSVILRPSRHGLQANPVGPDTVEFTQHPGQKVSVEFDTEIKASCFTGPPYGIPCLQNILMIFADVPRSSSAITGVPASDLFRVPPGSHEILQHVPNATPPMAGKSTLGTAEGRKVVVFRPGVYDIGYWQVPKNIEQIHLEGGAVVFGAIDVLPQSCAPLYDAATINHVYRDAWARQPLRSSFKVTGPGILSGAKLPWHLKKDFTYTGNDDWWAHVKGLQLAVTNITVEDVTLVNSPYWVLSFLNDADARTRGTFDNFKMVGAWTYNNDGLPNPTGSDSVIKNAFIHANDDAFKLYNSGSTIENCVVWQANNGAVVQFGWFPKSCSGVTMRDIDVIHFENWYGVNQPNRAVFNFASAGGHGVIRHMHFENFNVEGRVLRLFGINITTGRQALRDFTFSNLAVGGLGVGQLGAPGANYFIGDVTDWHFTDFVLGDTVVTNRAQAESLARFEFLSPTAGQGFTFSAGASLAPSVAPGRPADTELHRNKGGPPLSE